MRRRGGSCVAARRKSLATDFRDFGKQTQAVERRKVVKIGRVSGFQCRSGEFYDGLQDPCGFFWRRLGRLRLEFGCDGLIHGETSLTGRQKIDYITYRRYHT